MPKTDPVLLACAKAMRREMSEPERRLWAILRAKQLAEVKFARQVVIEPYIADFVARSYRLIVEVDGDTHSGDEKYDERRTALLEKQGYRVIRFANSDIMSNPEAVHDAIVAALSAVQ